MGARTETGGMLRIYDWTEMRFKILSIPAVLHKPYQVILLEVHLPLGRPLHGVFRVTGMHCPFNSYLALKAIKRAVSVTHKSQVFLFLL